MPSPRRVPPLAVVLLLLALAPALLPAVDRVPRPTFESGYQLPELQVPAPRSLTLEYLDVAVLVLALAAASWLALRARSRQGIFLLSAFSIAYFGFFRKGCICPIGSIQNVALALFDPTYALPTAAVAFFALPLVTALFVGRSFCAAVCPFGALQDAMIVKPLRLPRWLATPLGFLPVVYLGLAVLFAAAGAEFIVCRFDPFVSFFRMGGRMGMLALGCCFLALGTVVARPYCRFVCPYGVILGWLSRLSLRHSTISPDECVQCRLCEESCPFDAIRAPDPPLAAPITRGERRAFAAGLAALPVLVALGAFAGHQLSPTLARVHPAVRLAAQVQAEDSGWTTATTLESETFRTTRTTKEELFGSAEAVRQRFARSGPLLGGFVMLVLTATFLASFFRRRRTEYQPDRGECFSCGRCFAYCPREHLRLKERGP
jgi:NosR/NirI family nitrous oxide reductase transcriptional regulator